MIEVRDLARRYGARDVFSGVRFHVEAGRTLALLGPNGCGKSTMLKVLAGVIPASAGSYLLDGRDGRRQVARQSTGYMPDTRGLFPRLTCLEHLHLACRLRGADTGGVPDLLDRVGLGADAAVSAAGVLSHGQSRRLSLAIALAGAPSVLLIDEPFDGVDPLGVDMMVRTLDRERARGAATIVTTHLLDSAAELADDVAIFHAGGLQGPWPTRQLLAQHSSLKQAWIAVTGAQDPAP